MEFRFYNACNFDFIMLVIHAPIINLKLETSLATSMSQSAESLKRHGRTYTHTHIHNSWTKIMTRFTFGFLAQKIEEFGLQSLQLMTCQFWFFFFAQNGQRHIDLYFDFFWLPWYFGQNRIELEKVSSEKANNAALG